MRNRALSLLLAVATVLSLMGAYAPRVNAAASGTSEDGLSWRFDPDGTLTISGNGKIEDIDWWEYDDKAVKLVINKGVTAIGDDSFKSLKELKTVVLPRVLI